MLLGLSAAALAASLGAAQEPKLPEFRADVRVIRLDVSVVDRKGRPLPGLAPEDFTVFEDGRPVEITYFEAVDGSGGVATSADSAVTLTAPPPRRILLLVDTGRMAMGDLIRARQSTARYLREQAGEGDWVRLVNLSTGWAWDGRIPEDRERLETAALALEGRMSFWAGLGDGDWSSGFGRPIEDRIEFDAGTGFGSEGHTSGRFLSQFAQSAGLLGVLESLLVQLEGVAGRKALVLISPGFPQLMGLDRELQKVATLARQSATAVYFLDSVGLEAVVPEPGKHMPGAFETAWRRSGGSQDLAEATGGFTYRFSNALEPGLARVAAEMQTYYVVGYTPSRPEDGRFRRVKVKVGVRGASVRTKKGYLAGAKPRR
ncbi:MAG TPA: VWA domain-containing protein [Vicinamibacteria bacterium]|nr:VWA domain-containing protein [Vicinamibacteria bacterium]